MLYSDAAAGALPLPPHLTSPAHWRCIDFISDLHLDADHPRTFRAWSHYLLSTPAQAVFILGDLFEAWVGDDAVQQEGFEAQSIQVLHEAAQHRWIGFMPGNRDFLLGSSLLHARGVQLLHDPTVLEVYGQRVLLTHGDLLCADDVNYQRFRSLVRNPAWQVDFLARPLSKRRELVRTMRDASREHQTNLNTWVDVNLEMAQAWLESTDSSVLVHGHTHRPVSEFWSPVAGRHVLSDWDLDGLGPRRAQVLRLTQDGFVRLDVST